MKNIIDDFFELLNMFYIQMIFIFNIKLISY